MPESGRRISWQIRKVWATHPRLGVFVCTLGFLAVFLPANLSRGLTGDEPHYLVLAQSLWRDGDLDLRNNYLERQYAAYYPREIDPHVVIAPGGQWYPIHHIGFALLLAPVFHLAGIAGVLVAQIVVSALLAVNMYSLAFDLTQSRKLALLAWAVPFTTAPLLVYSGQIYPEMLAALIGLWAFRRIRLGSTLRGHTPTGLGFALAALPWLHPRYALLVAPLTLFFCVRYRERWAVLAGFALPLALSALGNAIYYRTFFGAVTAPARLYPGVNVPRVGFRGIFGLLLHQRSGLLLYSPVHVVAIRGAMEARRERWTQWGMFLSTYVPLALSVGWVGGWSPPGHYLVSVLPFLSCALAHGMDGGENRGLRALPLVLWGVSSAFSVVALLSRPGLLYPMAVIQSVQLHTGVDLRPVLPNVFAGHWAAAYGISLLWLGGMLSLLRWCGLRRDGPPIPSEGRDVRGCNG